MFHVKAIIGVGYGDEGKGMWTHHLVKNSFKPLVVRNNGGAQVGHTVVENGKRYVFSHMGSGTLKGAPTLYTRHSVVAPTLYVKEAYGRNTGIKSEIFVEDRTPVTTHFDILLNQLIENSRGNARHGSTGCGFGVTLERMDDGVFLFYEDLRKDRDSLVKKLTAIQDWCLDRLPPLGAEANRVAYGVLFHSLDRFLEDCRQFCIDTESWRGHFRDYDNVIFENGQGLLLDQEYGDFPHVTRSNTGFRNIGRVLKRLGIFDSASVDIYYMSRCYTTRHGAGNLIGEMPSLPGIHVNDSTNIPNEFQGTMRLAPINFQAINAAIGWDKTSHPNNANIYHVVTCLDQVDPKGTTAYIDEDGTLKREVSYDEFLGTIGREFDVIVSSPEGL